jgi:hypothetical protein
MNENRLRALLVSSRIDFGGFSVGFASHFLHTAVSWMKFSEPFAPDKTIRPLTDCVVPSGRARYSEGRARVLYCGVSELFKRREFRFLPSRIRDIRLLWQRDVRPES